MDNIRWKVTDPLGNEIYLMEESFRQNITNPQLELQAKFTVEHPRFIIRDIQAAGRVKYLSLADVQDDVKIAVRTIAVVVDENGEVVTWFARRTINDVLEKEGVIYDERNDTLPV